MFLAQSECGAHIAQILENEERTESSERGCRTTSQSGVHRRLYLLLSASSWSGSPPSAPTRCMLTSSGALPLWPSQINFDLKVNVWWSRHRAEMPVATSICIFLLQLGKCLQNWSARRLSPRSGKKTPRNNAICNRGIYYWLKPGRPALTKGVRTKRPWAPVLSGIYWVQLVGASGLVTQWVVCASGLVTQLQSNFRWSNVGLSAFPW